MRVFIAGGTGLIGRGLAKALLDSGHQAIILSRNADAVRRDRAMWPYQVVAGDPTQPGRWQDEIDGCDAVVNLAGHSIFADRWSAEIKRKIRDSRVFSAEHLVTAIKNARSRPKVFVQGSAIGYYGPEGDQDLTESSPSGTDFLAVVCRECEDVSRSIDQLGVRRAIVRTGIVLAPNAGALKLMTPIFKLGPGAPIGSGGGLVAKGDQWMSWIHLDDIVGIFKLTLEKAGAAGPLNGTAPIRSATPNSPRPFQVYSRSRSPRGEFIFPSVLPTECSGWCSARWRRSSRPAKRSCPRNPWN